MSENFKKFQNKDCEYFPCHKGIPEEEFNCLFCFCPLYALKDKCGGNFGYHDGIKDCMGCRKPHDKDSYAFIMSKIDEVIKVGSDF